MHDILIIGGGYAGTWAALSAARQSEALGVRLDITLVTASPLFTARVRLYEAALPEAEARMPLEPVLAAVGVSMLCADVTGVRARSGGGAHVQLGDGRALEARAVVLASGSQLARPAIPGLAAHAHDIDTADAATRTWERLHALAPGARVDIVGGGFTGIELACEFAGWRRQHNPTLAIHLSDAGVIASGYGEAARKAVLDALAGLGVHCHANAALAACNAHTLTFAGAAAQPTDLLVWTAGLVPSPLAADTATAFAAPCAADGRLRVASTLALPGHAGVFAAGDVAAATAEDSHLTTLSCQHALSTGTFAGHNAVLHACGEPPLDFTPPYPYGTCIDLGPAGAMVTRGFARELVAAGEATKAVKQHINRVVIVPPLAGGRAALFAAADVQARDGSG